LLLSYELLKIDDFLELLDRKEKKSRFFSFSNYFSFLRTIPSQHNDLSFSITNISQIINHLGLGSILIDMKWISKLIKRYPFSLNEPSSYIQQITISPFNLSSFEEKNYNSIQRKKQGKFYTKIDDADFMVQLTIFRFLKNKIPGLDTKILFESVFFGTTFPQATKEISKNDRIPFYSAALNVLDPSCGSGTFLVCVTRLLIHLTKENLIDEKTILKLWGYDTDQKALFVARLRLIFLSMHEISYNSSLNGVKSSRLPLKVDIDDLICVDFLFHPIQHKYDLIFGNPPFVRQEDIGSNHVTDYKENLIQKLERILGSKVNIDKKSDLYIYFCLLGLSLLKNGGILAYLTSNAWLEVKYGLTLQSFLLNKRNRISKFEILQRSKIRLWSDIGINSIILICQKTNDDDIIENYALFVDSEAKFNQIPRKSILKGLVSSKDYEDEYYRVERIQRDELSGTHKWGGTFLRTNKHERTLLRKLSSSGISLSSVANIRFGIKTGSNDFFHLQIEENDDILKDDELEFIKNKLDFRGYIEKEYLLSLVKSPLHFKNYVILQDFDPDYWLFNCTSSPEKLKGTEAWKYIQWGEKATVTIQQGSNSGKTIQGFQFLKSVSTRVPWYSLPQYPIPTMLWTKSYHDKPGCLLNLAKAVPDQRFYSIIVSDKKYIPLIFTYLNSSLVWAQMESQGNTNMGYGVLDTNVYWLKNLKIPNSALNENEQIKLYMKRLIEEKERVPINSNSELRRDIDRFYARFFGIDKYSLECLHKYINKSVNNRIN
jgi:methylase of polypeptide subunit release factors